MSKGKKYEVFLSYSHKDRPWVSDFVSALRDAGIQAWFDVYDLAPGERWQEHIQEALRQSTTLVVILSPDSVVSPWTFFELGAAFADQKRIIPVLTRDMDIRSLPLALRRFQFLKEPSPAQAGKRVAEVIKKSMSEQA